MESILFDHVMPHVFEKTEGLQSEVWNKHITLEKGKNYLIEAHSGKGKSTFCSYVIGYRHDYAGCIMFNQQDISSFNIRHWIDIRRHHISYMFQELRLFPELTAWENVEIKNNMTKYKSKSEIMSWFEALGIADKMNVQVSKMSFGQQQRVAMMRALVQPFDFLLADEPISHLDDMNAKVMQDLMMTEVNKQGAGVIITSIGKHMPALYDKMIRL